LEQIDLDQILSEGYSFLIEMLYRVQEAGLETGEVPILFANRRCGASKISRREIARAVRTVVRLWAASLPWAQPRGRPLPGE
jgi:dolichol-phosphate mannosyltransferase